ncbi:ECF transporter S component [Streptococcus castoreus]|uniref:membrane protein n=1 Tax=Streptococcus castoreus TaxID=254786 RepID=UPI0004085CA5|nr:membrane protein [Streptococcus castoreus]
MSAKIIRRVAIMSTLCFVLRLAFSGLPSVQPITALLLVYLLYFGLTEVMLAMGIGMFLSAFPLGFGPWIFWQIMCFSFVLILWRCVCYPLANKFLRVSVIAQAVGAAFCAFLYGVMIDSCFAYLYSMSWWSYVLAGMSFNMVHTVSTLFFFPLILMFLKRRLGGK